MNKFDDYAKNIEEKIDVGTGMTIIKNPSGFSYSHSPRTYTFEQIHEALIEWEGCDHDQEAYDYLEEILNKYYDEPNMFHKKLGIPLEGVSAEDQVDA